MTVFARTTDENCPDDTEGDHYDDQRPTDLQEETRLDERGRKLRYLVAKMDGVQTAIDDLFEVLPKERQEKFRAGADSFYREAWLTIFED